MDSPPTIRAIAITTKLMIIAVLKTPFFDNDQDIGQAGNKKGHSNQPDQNLIGGQQTFLSQVKETRGPVIPP